VIRELAQIPSSTGAVLGVAGGSVEVGGGSVEVGDGDVGGRLPVGNRELAGVGDEPVVGLAVGGVSVPGLDAAGTTVADGGTEPQAPTMDTTKIRQPRHRVIVDGWRSSARNASPPVGRSCAGGLRHRSPQRRFDPLAG
jgi:hypothetical protein